MALKKSEFESAKTPDGRVMEVLSEHMCQAGWKVRHPELTTRPLRSSGGRRRADYVEARLAI